MTSRQCCLVSRCWKGFKPKSWHAQAAKVMFEKLRRCRHLSLRGCIQLDGSVLSKLAGTAATLQHLNCENIGEVPTKAFLPFLSNPVTKQLHILRGLFCCVFLLVANFKSVCSLWQEHIFHKHSNSGLITECCLVQADSCPSVHGIVHCCM